MPRSHDGGKWALAGFLYQMLGLTSITARAVRLVRVEDPGTWDEVTALVGSRSDGEGIRGLHEHEGQDAVFTADDHYVIAQFKYSASSRDISPSELREIIAKLKEGARLASSQGETVTACVLVTNRRFTAARGGSEDVWQSESTTEGQYQLRRWLVRPEDFEGWLSDFGAQLGLFPAEVERGISNLIGRALRGVNQPCGGSVSSGDILESFTGSRDAKPLTLEAVERECRLELQAFGCPLGLAQWNDTPVEREVFGDIVQAIDQRALVAICGGGGCGKSVILWQVLKQLVDRGAGSCMANTAANLYGSWVTERVHTWRNLQAGGRPGDDRDMAIQRLHIANPALPKYVLLLALDGLDEGVRGEQRGYIEELIRWFWLKDAECRQTGERPAATLVVSSRRRDELAREWLRLPPDYRGEHPCTMSVGDFSDEERRNAARLVSPELDRLLASVDGDALMREGRFYSSVAFDESMPFAESPMLDSRVLDSLEHPLMWRALVDMAPSDQRLALCGGGEGVGLLADKFVQLFTWRIADRQPTLAGIPSHLLVGVLRSVACRSPGRAGHSRAGDWVDPARATGLLTEAEALLLYEEALSGGVITAEADGSWRWRHAIVYEYLLTSQ